MGIKNFMSFFEENNKVNFQYDNFHNIILIDGTMIKTSAMKRAYSLYLENYKEMFNIHHIYQFVCLKAAIFCYQDIIKLITPSVEEILIFNDCFSTAHKKEFMEEVEKTVPQYFLSLFDKSLNLKGSTKIMRRQNNVIEINNEQISASEIKYRVAEELNKDNFGTYSKYLRANPFLDLFVTENISFVVLAIFSYFLKSHFSRIKVKLIRSYLEADFSIYNYVYHSYYNLSANEEMTPKILIVSRDSDYYICGYHPTVYLYNMEYFTFPYEFWNNILFKYYDRSIDISELLIRVSFIMGNDYFIYKILPIYRRESINKFYKLLNIEGKFRFISTDHSRSSIAKYVNKTTCILNKFNDPFSPELLDLIILSGLPTNEKTNYLTTLCCLKYAIYNLNNDTTGEEYSLSSILEIIKSEIKQEPMLKYCSYNQDINPFMIREYKTDASLLVLLKDQLGSDNLLDNPCRKSKIDKFEIDQKTKIKDDEIIKDYEDLINLVTISL